MRVFDKQVERHHGEGSPSDQAQIALSAPSGSHRADPRPLSSLLACKTKLPFSVSLSLTQ